MLTDTLTQLNIGESEKTSGGKHMRLKRPFLSPVALALVGIGLSVGISPTLAQTANSGDSIRCATRLSVAILGEAATPSLLQSKDPQAAPEIDAMFQGPVFIERFSSFINSKFNDDPGAASIEDSAYHLAKHVLQNNLPWTDLFVGKFNVVETGPDDAKVVQVQADPNGLGYFRSPVWLDRYAGNELEGLKINTAYRMLNNVLGLDVATVTLALPDDADVSGAGREAAACRGCHYDSWFALDRVADVLTRVQRDENNNVVAYLPNDGQPKMMLGGIMIKDDRDLIENMVKNDAYFFNQCRLGFQYLYGRAENECEGTVFDSCVSAMKTEGTIQAGLTAIVKDKSFCR